MGMNLAAQIILLLVMVISAFGTVGERDNQRQKVHAVGFTVSTGAFIAITYFLT